MAEPSDAPRALDASADAVKDPEIQAYEFAKSVLNGSTDRLPTDYVVDPSNEKTQVALHLSAALQKVNILTFEHGGELINYRVAMKCAQVLLKTDRALQLPIKSEGERPISILWNTVYEKSVAIYILERVRAYTTEQQTILADLQYIEFLLTDSEGTSAAPSRPAPTAGGATTGGKDPYGVGKSVLAAVYRNVVSKYLTEVDLVYHSISLATALFREFVDYERVSLIADAIRREKTFRRRQEYVGIEEEIGKIADRDAVRRAALYLEMLPRAQYKLAWPECVSAASEPA
jgi:hypothetical protein